MKYLHLLFPLFFVVPATAQDFPGYSASPYSGIAGAAFNPATLADHPYRLDILLVGASAELGNNYAGVKRADLYKPNFGVQDLRLRDWSTKKSAFFRGTVLGPGVMVSDKDKGWGVDLRVRTYLNVDGVGRPLAEFIAYGFDDPPQFGIPYNNRRLSVNLMSWGEIGGTYARVLRTGAEHYLSAGVRPKFLMGLAAAHVDLNNADYSVPNDSIIVLNNGDVRFMHSDQLTFNSALTPSYAFRFNPGFGLDAGIVYEFRPDDMQEKEGKMRPWPGFRERPIYKFRIGLALLDLGAIRFRRGEFSDQYAVNAAAWDTDGEAINQTGPTTLYNTLELRTGGADAGETFWMRLPLSLNLHGDYRIQKDFFISGNAFAAVYLRSSRGARVHELTRLSITPRYERRWWGVWMPFSFSRLGVPAMGAGVRIGPLVVGTNDLLALAFRRKTVFSADAYFVLKVPLFPLPGGKSKTGKTKKKGGAVDECAD